MFKTNHVYEGFAVFCLIYSISAIFKAIIFFFTDVNIFEKKTILFSFKIDFNNFYIDT